MLATNVVLIFSTAFLSMGTADEKVSSESLEDELERCHTKSLEVNQKLIEFKFQIIELQGKVALIKELQNTIESNERQLKSSEEALQFCHKIAQTSKNNSNECQPINPQKGIKHIILNDANSEKDEQVDKSTNCDSLGFASGVLTLKYVGAEPFSVFCDGDTAGPGWILIQQRIDGAVDFYKNWKEYRDGFGNVTGEHFIGLQKLYMMTNYKPHELYIQLKDFKDEIFYAHYEHFQIGNEMEKYKLKKLGKMTGNLVNKFVDHLGHKFSTYDMDNGNGTDNLAVRYHSGWWFFESTTRYGCNLNGKYLSSPSTTDPHRLHWQWKSYKGVKMFIHPIKN